MQGSGEPGQEAKPTTVDLEIEVSTHKKFATGAIGEVPILHERGALYENVQVKSGMYHIENGMLVIENAATFRALGVGYDAAMKTMARHQGQDGVLVLTTPYEPPAGLFDTDAPF